MFGLQVRKRHSMARFYPKHIKFSLGDLQLNYRQCDVKGQLHRKRIKISDEYFLRILIREREHKIN